jgi:pimeloyl-ACP methyl ester carboxylesterase
VVHTYDLCVATFYAPDGTRLAYHQTGEGSPLICVPGGPMQASAYLGDLGGLDPKATGSDLSRLRAPVLLIAGEYDVGLPPKRAAEYASMFPQAEPAVQPGGWHHPWLDDPQWFVQTVTAFLP